MKPILILVFTIVFFYSCSTPHVPQALNPDVIYKRDMIIKIDGQTFEGVGVVPLKEKHSLHIVAQGDLDLFTFTTCHREETAENAWNVTETTGLFRRKIDKKREVKMDYTPTPLEARGGCPIFLGGYEEEKGRHSWGVIDFETPEASLPAHLQCNGQAARVNGVSICQSRMGLIQMISFEKEVRVIPSQGCEIKSTQGKEFVFPIVKGECVYAFMHLPTKEVHRLTTIGYEIVPIRK